jgi:hypothetical protein
VDSSLHRHARVKIGDCWSKGASKHRYFHKPITASFFPCCPISDPPFASAWDGCPKKTIGRERLSVRRDIKISAESSRGIGGISGCARARFADGDHRASKRTCKGMVRFVERRKLQGIRGRRLSIISIHRTQAGSIRDQEYVTNRGDARKLNLVAGIWNAELKGIREREGEGGSVGVDNALCHYTDHAKRIRSMDEVKRVEGICSEYQVDLSRIEVHVEIETVYGCDRR